MSRPDEFRDAALAKAYGDLLRSLPPPAVPLDDAELAQRLAEPEPQA